MLHIAIRFGFCVLMGGLLMLRANAQQPSKCLHYGYRPFQNPQRSEDPGNLRSDSLDVLHYQIHLDMTSVNTAQLHGSCTIQLKSKLNNITWINLDLEQLVVDSILSNNIPLNFNQSANLIQIPLTQPLSANDSLSITVFYGGTPAQDPSFGGMYFQNGYAYNIGVAFEGNPHNFGRAWFPCFDNFVERSTFEVSVLTHQQQTAYCSGVRTSVLSVGTDSTLTTWQLDQPIPTYLASIAVSNYVHVTKNFESISGNQIPIWLTAKAADTLAMKQSFINIVACAEGFENRLGLYRWPRIGYSLVPFFGGAMEHATNIAYPKFAVNGSLDYENLYAHELAHHWFGDLVTCRNADDMWLNEGWASYCESLFMENLYGPSAYRNNIREVHKQSLSQVHRQDQGRYPVSGIPTELTYGGHVYTKGADMVHTLRNYMGDQAFFTAIQAYMEEFQFQDATSNDLRDFFQNYTNASLTDFFDDWIFQPGFPEFRIRNWQNTLNNQWLVNIEQYHHYNTHLHQQVPMTITVLDNQGQRYQYPVILSGALTNITLDLPDNVLPVAFFLNENDGISQAVLAENKTIGSTSLQQFTYADAALSVANFGGADSIFVRIENHFAAADPSSNQSEFFLSPDRWWNIFHTGNDQSQLNCQLKFFGNSNGSNFYDPLFFQYLEENNLTENDIIMVYRPDGITPWVEVANFFIQTNGSSVNWEGNASILGVMPGQYTWAIRTNTTTVKPIATSRIPQLIHHQQHFTLKSITQGHVLIYSNSGQLIHTEFTSDQYTFGTQSLPPGIYHVIWVSDTNDKHHFQFLR